MALITWPWHVLRAWLASFSAAREAHWVEPSNAITRLVFSRWALNLPDLAPPLALAAPIGPGQEWLALAGEAAALLADQVDVIPGAFAEPARELPRTAAA